MALKIACSLLSRKIWSPLSRKISIAGFCALTCAWLQAPVAFAQHGAPVGGHAGGGHPAAGGHANGGPVSAPHVVPPHAVIPPAAHAPISRSPVVFGPRTGLGQRPIFIRNRVFLRPPFFRFAWSLYPGWWLNCGPAWVWGFGCGDWQLPEYGTEYYVPPPPPIYEYPEYPQYVYYGGPRDFVLLFLKDGTEYSVTDYWFVKDEVHFITLEEGGTKAVEQVIGLDELDLQKTIDVNTRRGFRFVRRDEPMEQYLRDHPDANPPLVEPPPKS